MKEMSSSEKPRNTRTAWTVADMKYVEQHYCFGALAEIAQHLGRTKGSVIAMAAKLGCLTKRAPSWSDAEKAVLLRHYAARTPMHELRTMLPGRTPPAIMEAAKKLGLSRPEITWTNDEIQCLQQHYTSEGQRVLRRLPGKSNQVIRDKARELGLPSPGFTRFHPWDEREWQLLRDNRHLPRRELMRLFPDRSLSSIQNGITRLSQHQGADSHPPVKLRKGKVVAAWSEAEKEVLYRWFKTHTPMAEILAKLPGRSLSAVLTFGEKLGLARPRSNWTADELQILREFYPTEGSDVIDRLPGHLDSSVRNKASQLGLRMRHQAPRRPWSAEEWQRLEESQHLPEQALRLLFPDRSLRAVQKACQRLKARQKRRN